MNVKEARRLRLEELKNEAGTLREIARRVNPGAKYLDRYLSEIRNGTREMGDALARDIEKAFTKPNGWMDQMGVSSPETGELLHIWSQFPPEEQQKILYELKIRLEAIHRMTGVRGFRGISRPLGPKGPTEQ